MHLDVPYGITRRLPGTTLEAARTRVVEALRSEGFGVLTEIDVKKTMKAKLDVEFRPYIILGACNPQLAHKALTAEPDVGLMLPCNVVVYEEVPGSCVVEAISPMAALGAVDSPALNEVADQAQAKLEAAMDAVASAARLHLSS